MSDLPDSKQNELTNLLNEAFLIKMLGSEEQKELESAQSVSLILAKNIVKDRGEDIYATVVTATDSPEEYRHWNITTWVIADWVQSRIDIKQTNPVNLTKKDEAGTHDSWKQWIVGVETPYFIVKENGGYEISEDLNNPTSHSFTVTWIDAGTRDKPKEEAHMITVVDKEYYDTASFRDEDIGFHSIMNSKGYTRREFISPYENFCTIWSWLFIDTLPNDNRPGWEKGYIKKLFPEPRPPEIGEASVSEGKRKAQRKEENGRNKKMPKTDLYNTIIKLRF
jgi:hypothetical protein